MADALIAFIESSKEKWEMSGSKVSIAMAMAMATSISGGY